MINVLRSLFVSYKSNCRLYRIFIFHRPSRCCILEMDRGQPTVSSIERKRKREIRVFERSHVLRNRGNIALKCSSILPLVATRSSMRRRAMPRIFRNILPRGACIDDRADDLVFSYTEIEFVGVNSILHLDRARDLLPSRKPSNPLSSLSLFFSLSRSSSPKAPFVYCSILCIHCIDDGPWQLVSIRLHRRWRAVHHSRCGRDYANVVYFTSGSSSPGRLLHFVIIPRCNVTDLMFAAHFSKIIELLFRVLFKSSLKVVNK